MIIKDGALAHETYSSDQYNTTAHQGYSATKTLGALIAGWAVTHSKLDIDAEITKAYGVKSQKAYQGYSATKTLGTLIAGWAVTHSIWPHCGTMEP